MEVDLRIKQGSNFKRIVNVVEDGTAKNLTGYQARMQIRENKNKTSALLSDVSSNITINNPNNGQFTINIPATVTETYTWSSGAYDVELFTGSEVLGILEGYVSVEKEVTG